MCWIGFNVDNPSTVFIKDTAEELGDILEGLKCDETVMQEFAGLDIHTAARLVDFLGE